MILRAKKISKSFDTPAPLEILKDISLDIQAGESVAITGKSGEGKTTLLHILGSLEKPSSGSIELLGKRLTAQNAAKLRSEGIGFIFQAFHLLEDVTVLENVLMPALIARKEKHAAEKRALQLIKAVGLVERTHFLARQLSGGEKQRVAIARALCNDPPLLIADEPSGNLDQGHSSEIHALLLQLVKEQKKSLIVATHDLNLAKLCNRTYYLSKGILSCTC